MTVATNAPLTKVQIDALKSANEMVAFYHKSGTQNSSWGFGTGEIRARRDDTTDGIYRQMELEIRDLESHIETYTEREEDRPAHNELDGYHYMTSPRYNKQWQTILSLLKPGDFISLRWFRGNNNGYMKDAGLHCDELYFSIVRNTPKSRKVLTFLLAFSVGQPNSARMVRSEHERRYA